MGRRVKVRDSYIQDAQFLLRLRKAIEADTIRPEEWKENLINGINVVATALMNAPTPANDEEE